ncbi:hypothetical protein K6119_14585 [Paracrocinitomix mangrovi]|uniref:hypothetical protein n=1 Tax=Paracrocinitomix mangrovi TaxID=2862509 RepID=UPI001C8DBB8B|nr:hypothetical protein [Paracrocinitomix mangrovi]UKN00959.1 hypothetical protein K6119_14585 [Paracrocinitomix mangrovi]
MKGVLVLISAFIVGYSYLYLNSALVFLVGTEEIIDNYWIGKGVMITLFSTIVVVLPLHIWIVRKISKQEKWDFWGRAFPFLVIPYMLGVTLQALSL